MNPSLDLPWSRIHEFLLDVGSIRDPKRLCIQAVRQIYPLVPYDQARVYFVNANGKIYDEFLIGVDPWWSELYREHYSQILGGRYSISSQVHWGDSRAERGCLPLSGVQGAVYDWTAHERNQFVVEYIRPQRIHYSAGAGLHDAGGCVRSVLCLDRISRRGYSQHERNILNAILPHLDNLHQNLFVASMRKLEAKVARFPQHLTRRESQIVELLCQGMTPNMISRHLCLSLATVYRHIANIYEKLGVSNRQELLLRLLADSAPG